MSENVEKTKLAPLLLLVLRAELRTSCLGDHPIDSSSLACSRRTVLHTLSSRTEQDALS